VSQTATDIFLVPPTKIEYDEEKNCAEIFIDLLNEYGYTAEYTGTTTDKFYLSSVFGIDTANAAIPMTLRGFLSSNKVIITDTVEEDGALGEFDLTGSSGWVYTVNGEMPSVAMSDYYPEENDVIRLRYSLSFGVDTGNYPEWGFDYTGINIQNTDDIVRAIAEYGAENCQAAMDELSDFDVDIDSIYRLLPVN